MSNSIKVGDKVRLTREAVEAVKGLYSDIEKFFDGGAGDEVHFEEGDIVTVTKIEPTDQHGNVWAQTDLEHPVYGPTAFILGTEAVPV